MQMLKQFLLRDIILIDARVLLFIVPSAMMLMRAIMNQNLESVIELIGIGVLSYLWMDSRQKHFIKQTYMEDTHDSSNEGSAG